MNDLASMLGEVTLTIGGQDVTVHEYTFLETLKLGNRCEPIIKGFADASINDADDNDYEQIISDNSELWVELIAENIGQPTEFVAGLGQLDGDELGLAFWQLNAAFFLKRLSQKMINKAVNP